MCVCVCDRDGIVPEALQACLEQQGRQGKPPGLLYTVPVGQNPTGNSTFTLCTFQLAQVTCRKTVTGATCFALLCNDKSTAMVSPLDPGLPSHHERNNFAAGGRTPEHRQ